MQSLSPLQSLGIIHATDSLRKQPTSRHATNGFLAKRRLRNKRRNSIPDLDSASDWLKQICHAAKPITSTTQIWVVTSHQYGISSLASQAIHGKVWFSTLRPLLCGENSPWV